MWFAYTALSNDEGWLDGWWADGFDADAGTAPSERRLVVRGRLTWVDGVYELGGWWVDPVLVTLDLSATLTQIDSYEVSFGDAKTGVRKVPLRRDSPTHWSDLQQWLITVRGSGYPEPNWSSGLESDRVPTDLDREEARYEVALEIDPTDATNLRHFAWFLAYKRNDLDRAEAMYERALAADPNHADNLGAFAIFLEHGRKELDRAEAMYERALAADPNHADNLGNFAVFLADDRKELDRAEAMYKRAVRADRSHLTNLGNAGGFFLALRDQTRVRASRPSRLSRAAADPCSRNRLLPLCPFTLRPRTRSGPSTHTSSARSGSSLTDVRPLGKRRPCGVRRSSKPRRGCRAEPADHGWLGSADMAL